MWLDSLTGMSAADQFIYMTSDILDHGISILYLLLAAGVILNLINAILFSMKEQYENAQGVMLLLRITSVITYIALLWGLPFAVFFLIGPDQNKHIFFLIALSFPALNLSGAFYAVSLTLDLRKKRRISSPTAVFYLIASFILGLDIITAFLIRRNRKVRLS